MGSVKQDLIKRAQRLTNDETSFDQALGKAGMRQPKTEATPAEDLGNALMWLQEARRYPNNYRNVEHAMVLVEKVLKEMKK